MDIGTALRNCIAYPFSTEQVELAATKRGLTLTDVFTKEIGETKAFKLASADLIKKVILSPNISQGGVSLSYSDRKALIADVNRTYRANGELDEVISEGDPTVRPIEL